MIAHLSQDGVLVVAAENATEAFALKTWWALKRDGLFRPLKLSLPSFDQEERAMLGGRALTYTSDTPTVLEALMEAERFISGFEDDPMQEGIKELLEAIRSALHATKVDVA
jgi:hypothetical protein